MNDNIGLFLNGLNEWYINICSSFKKHGKTWIQQSKKPKSEYLDHLKHLISKKSYIYAFGYAQTPFSKVLYRFKISEIVDDHKRISPPDDTAPIFSKYDIEQGGCSDNEYKYPMWLRVSDIKEIGPIDKSIFINVNNNSPIQSVRGNPNYVVQIPIEIGEEYHSEINDPIQLLPSEIEKEQIISQLPRQILKSDFDLGISVSMEKDLQRFISINIDTIEPGLTIYPDGLEYSVLTGRIDILCKDKNDNFVVIELKAGKANLDAYGQIKSYIAALKNDIAKNSKIRGFIIARDFDDKLVLTVNVDNEITLLRYNVRFEFNEIKNDKINY
jgi:hypothetical protein